MQAATDTRDESYRKLKLGEKQRTVLRLLRSYGYNHPLSDSQIAFLLDWPINCVTGRRNELVSMGLIERAGNVLDRVTNRKVATWRAKEGTEAMG